MSSSPSIKALGISESFIFPKLSGHGIHIHCFLSGLRDTEQLLLLTKVIHQKLPLAKSHSFGSDPRCLVEHQKIREFGAKNEGHYVTLITPQELKKSLKKKKYPINKKEDSVKYPKIKIFKVTPKFIRHLHELEAEFELDQEKFNYGSEVDYEKDGDINNLYKCPTIQNIKNKAESEHHLTHAERLALCQSFICFGRDGRKEIHKILKNCKDYDENYSQWVIEDNMKRGYRPFTCKWIKANVGCPPNCKGSGGKSPIKYAWGPVPLEDVLAEFQKVLVLHPEDIELIEICLAVMLDTKLESDLVWLFLVAPSAWGKSVIITSLHNPKWSIKKDSITDKTFFSGKTYKDKHTGEERLVEGLLPKLKNKTLLIKEFTTQLMRGEQIRNSIFGQMRAIYDEEYDAAFGSIDIDTIPEEWKHVRMGFLAGCTPFIDRYSTLNIILGERYLKVRMREPNRFKAAKHSILHSTTIKKQTANLRKKVTRFLSNINPPVAEDVENIPEQFINRLVHLSEMVVLARKPVTTNEATIGLKTYGYEDQTELATRIGKQLTRLGIMLSTIRGTKFDEDVFKAVTRVAFDTSLPSRARLIKYLYNQKKPVTKTRITRDLGWGHNRVRNHMTKMVFINAVVEKNEKYELSQNIRYHIDQAKIRHYCSPRHNRSSATNNISIKHSRPIHTVPSPPKTLDETFETDENIVPQVAENVEKNNNVD